MQLPVNPPVSPMLAKASPELPTGDGWLYEPKWDGFRCIVFRDGDEIVLGSRNERPLTRYFPELLRPILEQLPERCVLDGELVIATPEGLAFDTLQLRIHPAESRIHLLAVEAPASFVAFDVLALGDRSLLDTPLAERRALLDEVLADVQPPLYLCPSTTDADLAATWFVHFEGAGLDGVIAKRLEGTYEQGKRSLLKIKHKRTADVVVAGYRTHKSGDGPGSLLLGLYDDQGRLNHVGVASSFSAARRVELAAELGPCEVHGDAAAEHPWAHWVEAVEDARADGQRLPGGVSRWNATKDLSFQPLRTDLVAEVAYEGLLNGRFRHSARFVRWRPDRDATSCTYAQLEEVPPLELRQIFGG
ncbi:MAG: ATP-dependent DNA ligase [Acidimicrobiales bacterium]|nr:ATP-dependent DNA ligase [Acidimicrobiales bacterium]